VSPTICLRNDLPLCHGADRKSMLLKKSGSPSSASLEESDEHPGSAGNKLQLHTSGATLGRAPGEDQHSTQSVMRMTSQPMRSSEAQSKLLPAMSTSPPAPPMPHNAEQHQLPMMTGTANHSQGATVYQQYLQVCNCYSAGAKNIFKSVSFLQFWIEPCTKRCSSFVAFCLKQFVICHHPESRFLSESY
jgi:hypothetical protein